MKEFIIVEDLFTRYTVVLGITSQRTSVYCDECDVWVVEYDGDHLSTQTTLDLFEMIVNEHDEQKHGQLIEFKDWTETFK